MLLKDMEVFVCGVLRHKPPQPQLLPMGLICNVHSPPLLMINDAREHTIRASLLIVYGLSVVPTFSEMVIQKQYKSF